MRRCTRLSSGRRTASPDTRAALDRVLRRMRRPGVEPEEDVPARSLRSLCGLRLPGLDFLVPHSLLTSVRRRMRRPGVEPGLLAWEASVLPLDQRRSLRSPRGSQFLRNCSPTAHFVTSFLVPRALPHSVRQDNCARSPRSPGARGTRCSHGRAPQSTPARHLNVALPQRNTRPVVAPIGGY